MPVNMRTHAHGQGYADLNFLIPELVGAVEFHKGPYFVRDGDFASAGSVRIDYLDKLNRNIALATFGSFGLKRALSAASTPLGEGNLLVAGEAQTYDGPWVVPDALRKFNGVARYSQGTPLDGFAVTGMANWAKWNATNQIPERAVAEGIIGRYGTLDPTDGGDTGRFSLSGRWSQSDAGGVTRASAYVIRYQMNLWNNFTYFLNDPSTATSSASATAACSAAVRSRGCSKATCSGCRWRMRSVFRPVPTTFASACLTPRHGSTARPCWTTGYSRPAPPSTTRIGCAGPTGSAPASVSGPDGYYADVRSDTPANSGRARDGIVNPKLGGVRALARYRAVRELRRRLPLERRARGHGHHRPGEPALQRRRSPFLVPSTGSEIGIRNRSIAGLETSLALFQLDFASENLFQGDTGTTEPSRPTRRFGIEWSNHYAVTPWLALEGDLTVTNARFADRDPSAGVCRRRRPPSRRLASPSARAWAGSVACGSATSARGR